MIEPISKRLEPFLWPSGHRQNVWMIVDAARDPKIFPRLLESAFHSSCLYSGRIPTWLEASAPYLVQLEYEERHTRRLLDAAWGHQWGVLIRSDARLETLRRHLRRFLMVRSPAGQRLLFRYYDPRILSVYLPSCSGDELDFVFGPIESFAMETRPDQAILEFSRDGSKLVSRSFTFEEAAINPPVRRKSDAVANSKVNPFALLPIRKEQMALFSAGRLKQFEDWMLNHLRQFFPSRCVRQDEVSLRQLISYGIRRAASYGLTLRRDVCKYVDLMLVFGKDFDTNGSFPWAAQILTRRNSAQIDVAALVEAAKGHIRNKSSRRAAAGSGRS